MTYNVFGGTLSLTQSINLCDAKLLFLFLLVRIENFVVCF